MLRQALNREAFDGLISHLIEVKDDLAKKVAKMSKKIRRYRKREKFLRKVLRTHKRFPKRNEKWHQVFFSDSENNAVLITELDPPHSLMPSMKRISIEDAKTGPRIDGKPTFALLIDPCNDFTCPEGHQTTFASLGKARHAVSRKEVESFIDLLIDEQKQLIKKARKLARKIRRCKQCEKFLRGLLRTHTHFPERGDARPMYFFQDKNDQPVLVKNFIKEWVVQPSENLLPFLAENLIAELGLPSSDERLLPEMRRVGNREVKTAPMKNGSEGIIIWIDPGRDFERGHKKMLVDFRKIKLEPYEEPPLQEKTSGEPKRERVSVFKTLLQILLGPIFGRSTC